MVYPDHLRPAIRLVLKRHFDNERSLGRVHSSMGSTTGAALARAGMRSIRMTECPKCRGKKYELVRVQYHKRRSKVCEFPCSRCDAQGEVGKSVGVQPIRETTKCCSKCKGVGKLYPSEMAKLVVPWFRCPDCRGDGYVDNLDAAHASESSCYYDATPENVSPVQRVLRTMRLEKFEREAFTIELAYGEVGSKVERKLAGPLSVAVWPLTESGRELVLELRPSAKRLHADMIEAWNGPNERHQSLATLANISAIGLIEQSLRRFFEVDKRTGFEVRAMAERLDGGMIR